LITLTFADPPLHDDCVKLERAEQAFGGHAAAVITFIAEVSSVENVEELIGVLGNEIKILTNDSLCVSIGSDYRAALVVAGKRFNRHADGRIDWSSVTRLKLVRITRVP
jgi:hypothetical protein